MNAVDNSVKTRHYVEFWYQGAFFGDSDIREIEERDPKQAVIMSEAAMAFCFEFFDRSEINHHGILHKSDVTNRSGKYYIDGEIISAREIMKLPDDQFRILKANTKGNKWKQMVKTRYGWYRPFEKEDRIVVSK